MHCHFPNHLFILNGGKVVHLSPHAGVGIGAPRGKSLQAYPAFLSRGLYKDLRTLPDVYKLELIISWSHIIASSLDNCGLYAPLKRHGICPTEGFVHCFVNEDCIWTARTNPGQAVIYSEELVEQVLSLALQIRCIICAIQKTTQCQRLLCVRDHFSGMIKAVSCITHISCENETRRQNCHSSSDTAYRQTGWPKLSLTHSLTHSQ